MARGEKKHTYRVSDRSRKAASKPDASVLERDELTREQLIEKETAVQRGIYRTGTDEIILRRVAIRALMERGEL